MSVLRSAQKTIIHMGFSLLTLVALTLASAVDTFGQTAATNIQISNSVLQPSVHRLGVNLGDQTYWDSGQMMKNLVFQNPGFEGLKIRTILKCAVVTANSCRDDNEYSGQGTGFWTGYPYQFISGASAGKSGTVVSTIGATNCSGCGQTVKFDQNINPAVGDYFVVSGYFPGTGDAGWWDNAGSGTITTETTDISPNSPGKQAVVLTAPAGKSTSIAQYFDNSQGMSFIQLNGQFEVTFRAKCLSGNQTINVNASRLTAGGGYLSQNVALTNQWKDYRLTFSANETGNAVGPMQLVFLVGGSSVELDDVSFDQVNSDPTNTTAFRDDVVNTLKQLHPGTLRMMAAGAALGSDIPNQLSPVYARYRGSFSSTYTTVYEIAYGIDEFLHLCSAVGADPWITIPTATTPAEMQILIQYLTGNGSDQWSASRIARGQTAPWTSVFGKIHLELGNETWNGDFKGETMAYPGYPQVANQVFGAARQTSGYQASKFDLVLSGWASVPGYNSGILATSTQHDSIDIAPYFMFNPNDEPQSTMFGAMLAEPEMWESPGGEVYQDTLAAATAPTKTYLNVYETNIGPMIGSITQTELNNLAPSIGAGLTHTLHMLMMMQIGVQYQNAFALQQYEFNRGDGKSVHMWGIVIDMGTTDRRRPQFLTQAMANAVIGGNMLTTTQAGANPTWNQPLSSDGVQLKNAHYLQSFAFQNGNQASVVIFNLNQTSALPVTFGGANAPVGTVQMTQITSANITDNNESASVVSPASQTLSNFNAATGLSLPRFSMTTLTWTTGSTQTPSFSVPAGTYTSTQTVTLSDATSGASIYYTTDGSTPTTSSSLYSGAIQVSTSQTIQAIAVGPNMSASVVASASYVIQSATPAPVLSLAGGTYSSAQSFTISDALPTATIYFTTDGSTPTVASQVYSAPITVSESEMLNAVALAPGRTISPVTSAAFNVTIPTAAPVMSVQSGVYNANQIVSIVDATQNATIYYTIDGGTPTTASFVYQGPVTINATHTLRANAIAAGYSMSAATAATYTLTVATPALSLASGNYTGAQTVAISGTTPGSSYFYTTDGTTPTAASNAYVGPFQVKASATVQVLGVLTGYSNSAITSASYSLTTVTSNPVISMPGGSYNGTQTVTIADAMANATIYYTVDGSTPTTASNVYGGPVTIGATTTLNAIAVAQGLTDSAVVSATYIIPPPAAVPTFSLAAGSYVGTQTVAILDQTPGATIYYTTDGSVPTIASAVYAGPITLNASQTVSAIAASGSCLPSAVALSTYTIDPLNIAFSTQDGFQEGQMNFNGVGTLVNGAVQLTNGGQAQAGSAWLPNQVGVNGFVTDFDFRLTAAKADGFTFTLQNSPKKTAALGAVGSYLGYKGITKSITVAFDLYQTGDFTTETVGVYTGGATPQANSISLKGTGLDLHNGNVVHAHIAYSGTTLTVTLTDSITNTTATKTFTVDIPASVGDSVAYAGFTGASGSNTAVQSILNWTFANQQ